MGRSFPLGPALSKLRKVSRRNKILLGLLAALLIGGVTAIALLSETYRNVEKLTEFYLLGVDDVARGYPYEVVVGQQSRVKVGIANHEGEPVEYQVAILLDGEEVNDIDSIILSNNENWEQEVSFTVDKSSTRKVEFNLYKNQAPNPYRTIYLWVTTIQP